ncbi:hypothetical protein ACHHRT_10280 [Desulfurivibrio sp. D14AmB]|uniref:hypothetical protein n=1 Tax=Desulfurivibrio sp. D14AmB TaxID=3374370 RepID=UPI00376F22F1
MRTCSLQDFMAELEPWLDSDHIRSAELDQHDHLILYFLDGMKNVYEISDCNRQQIGEVLSKLRQRGIPVQE